MHLKPREKNLSNFFFEGKKTHSTEHKNIILSKLKSLGGGREGFSLVMVVEIHEILAKVERALKVTCKNDGWVRRFREIFLDVRRPEIDRHGANAQRIKNLRKKINKKTFPEIFEKFLRNILSAASKIFRNLSLKKNK